jgi:hypothetical protein
MLDEAVSACTQQGPVLTEDGPSDWNAALGKANPGLFDGYIEHRARVGCGIHVRGSSEG